MPTNDKSSQHSDRYQPSGEDEPEGLSLGDLICYDDEAADFDFKPAKLDLRLRPAELS